MIPVLSLNNQPVLSISDLQLLAGYLNRVQRKEGMGVEMISMNLLYPNLRLTCYTP